VRAGGVRIDYAIFFLPVLPGAELRIEGSLPLEIESDRETVRASSADLRWRAPMRPGLHTLRVRPASLDTSPASAESSREIQLQVFVTRPSSEQAQGSLRGYRIGRYADPPFRDLEVYRAPSGFIEVWPDQLTTPLSPHFRLGQFLCKQESGWPKYLVLRPELILKLEYLLEHINERGIRANGLAVMSGFRTPWYNAAIENRTSSSRHLYGGAADIFIDEQPKDGQMDDLNADGRIDKGDANLLYDLLEEMSQKRAGRAFIGGLAAYRSTTAHGPFVHVDVRGYRARWGR